MKPLPYGWCTAMAYLVLLLCRTTWSQMVLSGQFWDNQTLSEVMFVDNNTVKIIAFSDGGTCWLDVGAGCESASIRKLSIKLKCALDDE